MVPPHPATFLTQAPRGPAPHSPSQAPERLPPPSLPPEVPALSSPGPPGLPSEDLSEQVPFLRAASPLQPSVLPWGALQSPRFLTGGSPPEAEPLGIGDGPDPTSGLLPFTGCHRNLGRGGSRRGVPAVREEEPLLGRFPWTVTGALGGPQMKVRAIWAERGVTPWPSGALKGSRAGSRHQQSSQMGFVRPDSVVSRHSFYSTNVPIRVALAQELPTGAAQSRSPRKDFACVPCR